MKEALSLLAGAIVGLLAGLWIGVSYTRIHTTVALDIGGRAGQVEPVHFGKCVDVQGAMGLHIVACPVSK